MVLVAKLKKKRGGDLLLTDAKYVLIRFFSDDGVKFLMDKNGEQERRFKTKITWNIPLNNFCDFLRISWG